MKIDKNTLEKFLESILLKGEYLTKDCVILTKEDGIRIALKSEDSSVAIRGCLKVREGERDSWGIDNFPLLVDVVKSFRSGDINIERKNNKLLLSQKKQKVSLLLRDISFITNTVEDAKLASLKKKEEEYLNLDLATVKEILSTVSAVKAKAIKISSKGGDLTIKVESSENSIEKTFDLPEDTKISEFSVLLGVPFLDYLSSVKGTIGLGVPNDRAIVCVNVAEDFMIEFFIGLMVE